MYENSSERNKGKKMSEEFRKKMSIIMKGNKNGQKRSKG